MKGLMEHINMVLKEEKRKVNETKTKQKNCLHNGETYIECTDFHRRDFGTFCKLCDKQLN